MRELLQKIVKELVRYPDKAVVREIITKTTKVLEIEVDEGDRGRILGRKGETLQSIRRIVESIAGRKNERVLVEIVDGDRSGHRAGTDAEKENAQ